MILPQHYFLEDQGMASDSPLSLLRKLTLVMLHGPTKAGQRRLRKEKEIHLLWLVLDAQLSLGCLFT